MQAKFFLIALVGVAFALLVGGGLYIAHQNVAKIAAPQGETAVAVQKPWIEVISPAVRLMGSDAKPIKTLTTGDELENGAVIKTEAGARATVHFPDASVLRIDSETTFTLDAAEYEAKSQKLIVKIRLAVGRLWSKIFALATPDSSWDVQTSNAVATVRGTAFGVEYKNNTSLVIGAERTVEIGILDPKTQKIIKVAAAVISPDTFVSITDADASPIAEGTKTLTPQPAGPAILKQDWILRNKADDAKLDTAVHALQSQGADDSAIRKTIREEARQPAPPETQPVRTIQPETKTAAPIPLKTIPQTGTGSSGGAVSGTTPVPKSLRISAKSSLSAVTEGDAISFVATVVMSDGGTKAVTTEAKWRVVGLIGSISSSGLFSAQLDPSVSELGSSSGSVIASWTDPQSGAVLFNSTPLFAVAAAPPQTPQDIGGQ